tara:strand:+ start:83 stop:250 length:168 start_codon:yes stop_codon:yes gene_type:complete
MALGGLFFFQVHKPPLEENKKGTPIKLEFVITFAENCFSSKKYFLFSYYTSVAIG